VIYLIKSLGWEGVGC